MMELTNSNDATVESMDHRNITCNQEYKGCALLQELTELQVLFPNVRIFHIFRRRTVCYFNKPYN